jgi:hypothetical protein
MRRLPVIRHRMANQSVPRTARAAPGSRRRAGTRSGCYSEPIRPERPTKSLRWSGYRPSAPGPRSAGGTSTVPKDCPTDVLPTGAARLSDDQSPTTSARSYSPRSRTGRPTAGCGAARRWPDTPLTGGACGCARRRAGGGCGSWASPSKFPGPATRARPTRRPEGAGKKLAPAREAVAGREPGQAGRGGAQDETRLGSSRSRGGCGRCGGTGPVRVAEPDTSGSTCTGSLGRGPAGRSRLCCRA